MQTITPELVTDKNVLLRFDIDVAITEGVVTEDFRLKAGLPTLQLCLDHAQKVTLIGHIGRPEGEVVPELSIAPILKWFENNGFKEYLISGKLKILENLRFDPREDSADIGFAKELAEGQDIFINEAFASYRPSASTTVLPTLLPHVAGLNFAKEVETLTRIRENPLKPLIGIMGGAKVEDKLPVIQVLAKIADMVLVGGKLISELLTGPVDTQPHSMSSSSQDSDLRALSGAPRSSPPVELPQNVIVGTLNATGFDISAETTQSWKTVIDTAKMIVWNGPVGKFEDSANDQSKILAEIILNSNAEPIIGGGDTVSLLGSLDLVGKFQEKGFVSTGGGAMLKFLSDGTLPTIQALG